MRELMSAPAHIGHGSSVTYRSQRCSRQPPSFLHAFSMASISAWCSAFFFVSRRLRPRPTILPSQTTTAPTGTSPSSAAFCASLSAAFIYFSCSVINSSDFPEQTRFRLLKFFPRNKAAVAQSGEDIKLLDRRRCAVAQRHLVKFLFRNERAKRRKAVRRKPQVHAPVFPLHPKLHIAFIVLHLLGADRFGLHRRLDGASMRIERKRMFPACPSMPPSGQRSRRRRIRAFPCACRRTDGKTGLPAPAVRRCTGCPCPCKGFCRAGKAQRIAFAPDLQLAL